MPNRSLVSDNDEDSSCSSSSSSSASSSSSRCSLSRIDETSGTIKPLSPHLSVSLSEEATIGGDNLLGGETLKCNSSTDCTEATIALSNNFSSGSSPSSLNAVIVSSLSDEIDEDDEQRSAEVDRSISTSKGNGNTTEDGEAGGNDDAAASAEESELSSRVRGLKIVADGTGGEGFGLTIVSDPSSRSSDDKNKNKNRNIRTSNNRDSNSSQDVGTAVSKTERIQEDMVRYNVSKKNQVVTTDEAPPTPIMRNSACCRPSILKGQSRSSSASKPSLEEGEIQPPVTSMTSKVVAKLVGYYLDWNKI